MHIANFSFQFAAQIAHVISTPSQLSLFLSRLTRSSIGKGIKSIDVNGLKSYTTSKGEIFVDECTILL